MSEEDEAEGPVEPSESGAITWIICLVLIGVLGSAVALVAYPHLRPQQLEPVLDPVDQVIAECHELVYNCLYDTHSDNTEKPSNEFDWEASKEIINTRLKELDQRINVLETKIKSIVPVKVDHEAFPITHGQLNHVVPKESPAQLISEIETVILALAGKSRELTMIKYQNILIQEIKKSKSAQNRAGIARKMDEYDTPRTAAIDSVLHELHSLVSFKLVNSLNLADNLSLRKRSNLMALYIEKCRQLTWLLKVNAPATIHKRITYAYSSIFDIQQGKDLSVNKKSVTRRRANFMNAAQKPVSNFIRNIRAFLQ